MGYAGLKPEAAERRARDLERMRQKFARKKPVKKQKRPVKVRATVDNGSLPADEPRPTKKIKVARRRSVVPMTEEDREMTPVFRGLVDAFQSQPKKLSGWRAT